MNNFNLKQLKALAKDATPGHWVYDQFSKQVHIWGTPAGGEQPYIAIAQVDLVGQSDYDGFYIAAVCPPVVLELIKQIEALQKELDNLQGDLE